MADLNISGLPPWLIPLAIFHIALVLVLAVPTVRAFAKAGAGALNAAWLILPAIGLVVIAVLMMMRVMPASGMPRVLAVLAAIPLVNVVFLWLFAFAKWTEAPGEPKARKRRQRTQPEDGVEREIPTFTGGDPKAAGTDATGRPGMVEPTLHAGPAATPTPTPTPAPTPGAVPDPVLGAGGADGKPEAAATPAAPGLSEQTLHAAAPAAPAQPAAVSATAEGEAAGDVAGGDDAGGDHTIVAGASPKAAADTGPATPAGGSKGKTKVAARTDEPPRQSAEKPGDGNYDLVGSTDVTPAAGDAFDEDGEPIGEARTGKPAPSVPADPTPAAAAAAGDVDEERQLRGKEITEDDLELAQGVVDDLNQPEADPTESPMVAELPLTDVAPDRVWLVRGVNARAANIEASIREEDIAKSVTGILVGRSNRADFIIDDESVSRNHARFVYLDGALQVEDLDSMNGTWLDGEKLTANEAAPLSRSADVEFGKIRLEVKEVDPE